MAFEHARVVALEQKLRLLLMTDDFFDEVRTEGVDARLADCWKFRMASIDYWPPGQYRGRAAYVEAEYFGILRRHILIAVSCRDSDVHGVR